MGADRCEVILKEQFGQLNQLGFATSIAQQAIDQRSAVVIQDAQSNPSLGKSAFLLRIHAAMCVPVIIGDQILALNYIFKNRAYARPFDQRDIQLAVAISHQTALTIQRMQLLERVRKEEYVSGLLQRHLSAGDAKSLLQEYLQVGQLPQLAEHIVTLLATDIPDKAGMEERLGAIRFSKILTSFYQGITDITFKHNGLINKSVGDGCIAIFGLPHQPENSESHAIEAALEIIQKISEISAEYGEPISVGVGIQTGPMITGYIGNQNTTEFTAFGYPIHVARKLVCLARPNHILVGQPTYEAIKTEYKFIPHGNLEVNPGEQIQAFELVYKHQDNKA